MLVQFTVTVEGREVGVESRQVSGTAAEIEEQIREMQQRTGRMALEPVLLGVAEQAPAPCCCGRGMQSRGRRGLTVRTTFGEIPVSRRVYQCQRCGRRLSPADAQFCCGRHRITKPLAQRICQLATLAHFPQLPDLLMNQHGVALSHDTLVQLVHDVGGWADRLRRADAGVSVRQRTPPKCRLDAPPRRIWISADGIMYCTNLRESDPDHPGRKRLVWQQMKVGCVAWEDADGIWHKQLVWGRESPEEFGAALWRLACRCGYVEAKEKLFAADGGAWCWDIQARYFSEATGILDWYHASEHVWETAKLVAPHHESHWAHQALNRLRDGGGAALLTWLAPQIGPRRGAARTALENLQAYLAGQRDHLDYPAYRQRGWPIGTGRMESSCKQLVGVRLKGPGMHWTEAGALAVTALKAVDLNEQWQSFWNSLVLSA
jgi:hypothetical protein